MSNSLSPGDYYIRSSYRSMSLYVNGTSVLAQLPRNENAFGSPDSSPSAWYFQQPDGQGGMWSIKEKRSGLYLSGSVDGGAIQAVGDVFYWDLWPSPPPVVDQSGYYQIFVHNTHMTVTLDPTNSTVSLKESLSDSESLYYQNWGLGLAL